MKHKDIKQDVERIMAYLDIAIKYGKRPHQNVIDLTQPTQIDWSRLSEDSEEVIGRLRDHFEITAQRSR